MPRNPLRTNPIGPGEEEHHYPNLGRNQMSG
ncbi:MAG: hypothetical protein QOD01_1516, partial [Actinomycetota bacterium]|nr:hypothetical protein [Actinomycetota bacterium]